MIGEILGHFYPIGTHHKGLVKHAVGMAVILTGTVVETLQELGPQGQRFLLQAVNSTVHQGQALACILEISCFQVTRRSLGGEVVFPVIGITGQDNFTVGIVLHHHERP